MTAPLAAMLLACGALENRAPRVDTVILVCDASTGAPCGAPVREATLLYILEACGNRGGCTFLEVYPRRDFGSVVVAEPILTPKLQGLTENKLEAKKSEFIEEARATLATREPCPKDCRRVISSNIPAAISVAASSAAVSSGAVDLIVATDGLAIVPECGLNFETRIPSDPAGGVECLSEQSLLPDLSGLHSVTFCGLDNAGVSATSATQREAFWNAYVRSAGGPTPRILPRCMSHLAP